MLLTLVGPSLGLSNLPLPSLKSMPSTACVMTLRSGEPFGSLEKEKERDDRRSSHGCKSQKSGRPSRTAEMNPRQKIDDDDLLPLLR